MPTKSREFNTSLVVEALTDLYNKLRKQTKGALTGSPIEKRENTQENPYFRDFSSIFDIIESRVNEGDTKEFSDEWDQTLYSIGRNMHQDVGPYVEIGFNNPSEGIFIERLADGSLQISAEYIPFLNSQEGVPKGLYAILNPQADARGNAIQVALVDPNKRPRNPERNDHLRNVQDIFDTQAPTPEEKQQALLQLAGLKKYINDILNLQK